MTNKGKEEHTMQKTDHLIRMRRSGWFDVIMLALILCVIFAVLGVTGLISYNTSMAAVTPEMTEYEINQSLSGLAKSRDTYLLISVILLGVSAVSLLCMRFISPIIQADLRKQLFMRKLRVVAQYVVAVIFTIVMLFPIYWMIVSSFKTSEELLRPVPTLWPENFTFQNYPNVLKRAPFGLYFYNTIVMTVFIMMGELTLGVLAAYGFSKGNFPGKNVFFLIVLGALMVPFQVTFITVYVMTARLNWLNTFQGLIIPNLVSAYFIFMLRQAFMSVDDSYLEAGRIDGMGRISSIIHVLCPMCAPTLITLSILSFIGGWNSYFWPKIITTTDARRTIAVGITYLRQTFSGLETSNYNEIMAGAVLGIVPIIALFLILQKYIMTGMSKAAMK